MNRRKFLQQSSAAGIAVAVTGCAATRSFNGSISAEAFSSAAAFDLNEITIDELQARMASGATSSRKVTRQYLDRIEAIDRKGPSLNSVIEVNPDAMAIAARMDEERKAGKTRGPLHGIPVLIKDNINTADKMMTTAGALALAGNIASRDAFIVERLREAGAVLLGKANLSEWANFRSSRSSSGWSGRGGQTRNPNVLTRQSSGSSSGSGAAVSANLCAIAIGTETNGSIISPASHCGVVGIKPTVGLWSRSGIIPISATQDTAGPMCRTVKDAAYLLTACMGQDSGDPATAARPSRESTDFTSFCRPEALKGKKIGIEKNHLQGNEHVVSLYKQAIETLKSLGAEVVEVELLKLTGPLSGSSYQVLQYEFKDGVNKYLRGANAKVKSLAEVIEFNNADPERNMPYFRQEILENCEAKKGLDEKEYLDALKSSISSRGIIDEMMRAKGLQAICGVSTGIPRPIDQLNGEGGNGFSFSSPAALAGYPHITLPMGYVFDLPVGFSFMAGAWQEAEIIGMAYAYEQASKKRKAPAFKLSV
jgi:amidase